MIIRLLLSAGLLYWIHTGSQLAITLAFGLVLVGNELTNWSLRNLYKRFKNRG